MSLAVSIKNAAYNYGGQQIFSHLSLEIAASERVAITGPSGVGKSTLLKSMAGLTCLGDGHIEIDGVTIEASHFPGVTLMQQRPALLPWLDVYDNILLGARLKGQQRNSERRREAMNYLQQMGLADKKHAKPFQLSGGQQQRIALARALANRPQLLLLDEPFSALDVESRQQLRHDVLKYQRELGFTLILVTHDLSDAQFLCTRHISMTSCALKESVSLMAA